METKLRIGMRLVHLVHGDITECDVDAVVSSANEYLNPVGAIPSAIAQKGGPAIAEACEPLIPVGVGEAVITTGGDLKAKFVIHAVGPRGGQSGREILLENAVSAALRIADEHKLERIAMPAISTGAYGYPPEECARIMAKVVSGWLRRPDTTLLEVRLVPSDWLVHRAFGVELGKIARPYVPPPPEETEPAS